MTFFRRCGVLSLMNCEPSFKNILRRERPGASPLDKIAIVSSAFNTAANDY